MYLIRHSKYKIRVTFPFNIDLQHICKFSIYYVFKKQLKLKSYFFKKNQITIKNVSKNKHYFVQLLFEDTF